MLLPQVPQRVRRHVVGQVVHRQLGRVGRAHRAQVLAVRAARARAGTGVDAVLQCNLEETINFIIL